MTRLVSHPLSQLAGGARAAPPASGAAAPASPRDLPYDVAIVVARTHSKVIGHYRRLLRNPGLTSSERADIEARLAREENAWLDRQDQMVAA